MRLRWNPFVPAIAALLGEIRAQRHQLTLHARHLGGMPIHPLRIVKELQDIIGQDMTLCVDMDANDDRQRAYVGKLQSMLRSERPLGEIQNVTIAPDDLFSSAPASGYPMPIVDHRAEREEALARYQRR